LCMVLLSSALIAPPSGGVSAPLRLPQAIATRWPPAVIMKASGDSRGGLRLLEWIPSQSALVTTARFTWTTLWRTMISELAPQSPEGAYVRPAPQTGSGASWPAQLPMVAGRYHVYVGNPCPWCHRVSIARQLRGLAEGNLVTSTRLANDPERASRGGWCFDEADPDPMLGAPDLKAVYDACTPGGYTGRCTAPLLVDLQTKTIISNESADIIRILNGLQLAPAGARVVDLYPSSLAAEIDATNTWTYELINNGVYRCGFATKQAAYERAERDVHEGLARAEAALAQSRFLCGEHVSEADVRLIPTIVRFDGVYAPFFRCGRFQVRSDYPHLARWSKEMLRLTGPDLFDLDDARRGYYRDLFPLNPGGLVPAGPSPRDLGWPEAAEADATAFTWRTL